MNPMNIFSALESFRKKELKPSEWMESLLRTIPKANARLNAFLEIRPEESLRRAKELDAKMGEIDRYPLFGIPIAIKDNFLVSGWKATAGSKILEGYVAPFTATSVERLQAAGAIVIGKTNLDEFAMGSSNENSAFGPVKNPWNLNCVPGGSSGGSAAAVAAGLCLGALGTDTGGSIRQPASLCGVVGMKPTYGRVSRYGIVAFSSSLDQVGPFGNSVWDVARLLEVMAGFDGKDATSSQSRVPKYTENLKENSQTHFRIGIANDWLEGVESEVRASFEGALKLLEAGGARIVPITLPHARYALSTYYLIAPSEASSNLARYDGVRFGYRAKESRVVEELYSRSRGKGFGSEVKLRIMLGTYALSSGYYDAFYQKANQVRRLIQKDFEEAFKSCDCIAAPTSPTTAFTLGSKAEDPLTMYLSDIFTLPANLVGIPGISIPCGLDSKRLPVGLQLLGRAFDEARLLKIAHVYEKARGEFPRASTPGSAS